MPLYEARRVDAGLVASPLERATAGPSERRREEEEELVSFGSAGVAEDWRGKRRRRPGRRGGPRFFACIVVDTTRCSSGRGTEEFRAAGTLTSILRWGQVPARPVSPPRGSPDAGEVARRGG